MFLNVILRGMITGRLVFLFLPFFPTYPTIPIRFVSKNIRVGKFLLVWRGFIAFRVFFCNYQYLLPFMVIIDCLEWHWLYWKYGVLISGTVYLIFFSKALYVSIPVFEYVSDRKLKNQSNIGGLGLFVITFNCDILLLPALRFRYWSMDILLPRHQR